MTDAIVFTFVIAAGLAGPLMYGSTGPVAGPCLALIVAGAALSAGVTSLRPVSALPVRAALMLAATLCLYTLLQSLPVWTGYPAHSVWTSVAESIGPGRGSISISAYEPLHALGYALMPIFAFIAAFLAASDDDRAMRIWSFLTFGAAAIVLATLVQHLVAPDQLLFDTKLAYFDSFTGPFVNRNTAAGFIGTALLLTTALGYRSTRQVRWRASGAWTEPERQQVRTAAIFAAVGALLFIALFLTRSRGGVLFSLLAFTGLFGWTVLHRASGRRIGLVLLGGAVLLAMLMSGKVGMRFGEYGLFDGARWCVYRSTVRAISDNLWFGTGLGTFENVFPIYRDLDCGLTGVWQMAHNTFLEGMLSLGVIFIPMLIGGCFVLIRTYRIGRRDRKRLRVVPTACLSMMALALLHSLVDFPLQVPGYAVFLAIALGSGAALSLRRRRSGPAPA